MKSAPDTLGLGLLGGLVRLGIMPRNRGAGSSALTWGLVFGLYLWWGSHQVGVSQGRAILLGVVAGLASAFWVYVRGAGLERPPADQPGVFLGRRAARQRRAG